ncbi:MAG: galactose mutarotase [Hyphomicrobiales bacterium]|nr:MAG: galactose mutarotase [Hyphomicrobiales bacterium]
MRQGLRRQSRRGRRVGRTLPDEALMAVSSRSYDGNLGRLFTLTSDDIEIEVIEYGARLRSCLMPDAAGRLTDIVPGFDSPADYVERGGSMGAICGRYGNRIASGKLEVDGKPYQLSVNAPPHCLHGGFNHFGRHFWSGAAMHEQNAVRLTFVSPDGDEGWPGTLRCEVVYQLVGGRLLITMRATTDQATYVNLIFHGYWNLSGHDSGVINDHLLQVSAETYTPKNDQNVPSGEVRSVADSPFDFRTARPIGSMPYDVNFCLDQVAERSMRLSDPASGRALSISTNQPGVQLFTADNWSNVPGKGGAVYPARAGVALETQAYPNTPNIPAFNPAPLRPGMEYEHWMAIDFHP